MTTIPKEAIKAAARALRDFLNPEYGVYPVEQPTTAEYMREAEVALTAALPHLQEWVPISEGLPEEELWVEVYVANAYWMNHRRFAKIQRGEWRIGFDYDEASGD